MSDEFGPGSRAFSPEELAGYHGRHGAPAYVACRGKVYDVTSSFLWKKGKHRKHLAGKDLTEEMETAPHGADWLEKFPMVGVFEDSTDRQR